MTSPSDLTQRIHNFSEYLREIDIDTLGTRERGLLAALYEQLTQTLTGDVTPDPDACPTCGSTDGFHDEECIEANA